MPQTSAAAKPEAATLEPPRPLGPDSCTWRDFGAYMFHLMLPQAFVLQVAHPVIDAGVGEHSVYKTDPWGRAERSTKMLWPVVYARPETAVANGVALREFHRSIKGVDKQGRPYHALDPEAYGWVHMTGFDATIRMHELFGHPLAGEQRRRAFAEWQRLGRILGLRETDIPRNEAEYWQRFNAMIDDRLIMGEVASDLLDERQLLETPKPPGSRLPDGLWRLLLRMIAPSARRMVVGTLPTRFRSRFQLRWSRWDAWSFAAMRRMLRLILRLLPERWRYIPLAWAAIADARAHPEAYLWESDAPEPAREEAPGAGFRNTA